MQRYATRVAIEMHSSFGEQEASAESRDIVSSLWTFLPSRKNYAF
jgi:hypothetical protein